MTGRNKTALVISLASLVMLYLGVTEPMFHWDMEGSVKSRLASFDSELFDKTASILQTVEELWNQQRILVAVLIFGFSIVVPLLKTSLLVFASFMRPCVMQQRLLAFVQAIAKWSMADVFVVAIFLAFLATSDSGTASEHGIRVFGMQIQLQVNLKISSQLLPGFYWFLSYCLVSLAAAQLFKFDSDPEPELHSSG